jgi:hypothetical protein
MTRRVVTEDLTGIRHRVTGVTDDPRVVLTACGKRVALGGNGHRRPTPCPKEAQ